MKRSLILPAVLLNLAVLLACTAEVSSAEQARRAYLGLDKMVAKSITLGFAGFNAASSANISPQSTSGDKTGTLTITGQVDQGSSANKGMRLKTSLDKYSDGDLVLDGGEKIAIAYHTDAGVEPALDMQLKGIPTGTLDGTLVGDFVMEGDIKGSLRLNLVFNGQLESSDAGVRRKPGSTTITGTATSGPGVFDVNVSL